jgi:hypothetical protein
MHYAHLLKLIPLLFLFGCGGSALGTAKSTIVAAGQVWMEADARFAPLYERARVEARTNSDTWEQRDAAIEKWEVGRKALVSAGFALKSAALSIAIAEDGIATDWKRRTACAVEALKAAGDALAALEVDLAGLSKVLQLSQQLIGSCEGLDGNSNDSSQGP